MDNLFKIDESWRLGNADLLQEVATLLWVQNGDDELMKKITTTRIVYELYQRLSGENEIDALRNEAITKIAKWIQDHPKATKEEISKELAKQITLFAKKVDEM